jgi:hypothetical protein
MVPPSASTAANLRVWSVRDIKRFQDQFAWRDVTDQEPAEIGRFFSRSAHWQKTLDYIRDPDVIHVYCNIDTSVIRTSFANMH